MSTTPERFSLSEVDVYPYLSAPPEVLGNFDSWAAAMLPEPDGEMGAGVNGALAWAHNHNQRMVEGGLHQTFIFCRKGTTEVIATGSIVPDDRDVARDYKLYGCGFWGFVNVRRELRGRGLGNVVSDYMDQHVQSQADAAGVPLVFYLFTANPVAVQIYKKRGFVFQRQLFIKAFNATEDLYLKVYNPRAA